MARCALVMALLAGAACGAERVEAPAPVAVTTDPVASAAPAASDEPTEESMIAQCNRLIGVIHDDRGIRTAADANDVGTREVLAVELDAFAARVGGVPLDDGTLARLRAEYRTMIADRARRARDAVPTGESSQAMAEIAAREEKIVGAINRYCSVTGAEELRALIAEYSTGVQACDAYFAVLKRCKVPAEAARALDDDAQAMREAIQHGSPAERQAVSDSCRSALEAVTAACP